MVHAIAIRYVYSLHDGSEELFGLRRQQYDLGHNTRSIRMSWKKTAVAVPVIELFLK